MTASPKMAFATLIATVVATLVYLGLANLGESGFAAFSLSRR
jgi:hypothetical protein